MTLAVQPHALHDSIVRMILERCDSSEVYSHLTAVPQNTSPPPPTSSRDTSCPHTPPLPPLIVVPVALCRSSDPALSGCSKTVEQALMAWDFLSSSRDLVGMVLPPTKRMIHALTPPTGKVRETPGCTRLCVQKCGIYGIARFLFLSTIVWCQEKESVLVGSWREWR